MSLEQNLAQKTDVESQLKENNQREQQNHGAR